MARLCVGLRGSLEGEAARVFGYSTYWIHLGTTGHISWWIGGFRPSKLLQVFLPPQLHHFLSDQQLVDIYKFQRSCEIAEDALSQGMEKLQQIQAKATAEGDKGFQMMYVSQLVSFFKQADHIRQEFLHQFPRLLTISQQAQILLALGGKPRSLL